MKFKRILIGVAMLNKKCLKCSHKWIPRVAKPVECPKCKRRDWNKEKKK